MASFHSNERIAPSNRGIKQLAQSNEPIRVLAELGVIFLLFDIGLHFSVKHLRDQAGDIFGFGPVQILFGTGGLGLIALAFGFPMIPALLIGAILSLSSTAVVARIIAERHQQSCPVGRTAIAILVFQDLAAILLLIVVTAIGTGASLAPAILSALLKSVAAFAVALLFARFLVRPLFDLVARSRNEEVFTAMALFVALAAASATGTMGLSLTLGAFLGGMMLSETPYRAIIQSEIKPFRGLVDGQPSARGLCHGRDQISNRAAGSRDQSGGHRPPGIGNMRDCRPFRVHRPRRDARRTARPQRLRAAAPLNLARLIVD